MSSPALIRPLEDIAACDIPYWLPPGGRDNGIWADTWELIADLDSIDVATVLDLLATADIGAYVAVPGGRRARARGPVPHTLWVDAMQYGRAGDVLITFMRDRARGARATHAYG
ncbi:MAG: hypothetical protein QOD39_1670 [Mycobacterium sp.]|nr:hypothetical protein [Mycobacterium sp.]